MRCPKCKYIGFDDTDRCRNCGYSFALAAGPEGVELPIQPRDAPVGPFGDLSLAGHEREAAEPRTQPETSPGRVAPSTPTDLPLFVDRGAHDTAPLVGAPAPRAPLGVRRSDGTAARPRGAGHDGEGPLLDLDAPEEAAAARPPRRPEPASPADHLPPEAAGLPARCLAGLLDVVIVGSIQTGVVYLTLRLCGLRVADITILPAAPMIAFLLMLAGGYFTSFVAAGGQTIGKMATGLRVVPTPEADRGSGRVPFGHAVLRAAVSLISLLPAGAGLIPALLSPDRRTLHDRLADTRVIRG